MERKRGEEREKGRRRRRRRHKEHQRKQERKRTRGNRPANILQRVTNTDRHNRERVLSLLCHILDTGLCMKVTEFKETQVNDTWRGTGSRRKRGERMRRKRQERRGEEQRNIRT